jgi:hypothetical protein
MNSVFIIMPISADPNHKEKKEILKRVFQSENLDAHFPLEKRGSFELDVTIKDIAKSLFVLADLSYGRPSCYYELGLCQGIGKGTFLIAEEKTTIYQSSGSVFYYSDLETFESTIHMSVQEMKAVLNPDKSWTVQP